MARRKPDPIPFSWPVIRVRRDPPRIDPETGLTIYTWLTGGPYVALYHVMTAAEHEQDRTYHRIMRRRRQYRLRRARRQAAMMLEQIEQEKLRQRKRRRESYQRRKARLIAARASDPPTP